MESFFYSVYDQINETNSNQPQNVEDVLSDIYRFEKIGCYIFYENSKVIKYASKTVGRDETIARMISKDIFDLISIKMKKIKTDYIYDIVSFQVPNYANQDIKNGMSLDSMKISHDYNSEKKYGEDIIFIKELDTGEVLILSKSLHDLRKGSQIANEFLIYVGVAIFILSSIFIFFYSKRITRSILDLNHIAKSISNLDFSKKYKVKSKDEIGLLGESINLVSDELNKAMDKLMKVNGKLKEDIERKKEIDEMRKRFISRVSHELKCPIGITKGYVEGLKYNIANDEKKRNQYYNILIDEADKMDKIVKKLLNLSNLESDVFALERSIFDISVLTNEVAKKFKPILNKKEIVTKVALDQDCFVEADYLWIEQVICNYLTNATNHVDKNKYVEIKAQIVDKSIRISVINSGGNIPKKDLENIWDRFYKVDKTRSREYGGTGLGLAIVKSIIEQHKGAYGVINNEIGVEFWFELNRFNRAGLHNYNKTIDELGQCQKAE